MKLKICRWLYHHRMEWLAWRISPSLTFNVIGEDMAKGIERCLGAYEDVVKGIDNALRNS